jgi:hypothetical protein
MTCLRIFLFRLRALVRSRQMDRDIDDEIAGHLAEAADEYIRQGLSPEDAHRAARRSFGGAMQAKELYRQVRSFLWQSSASCTACCCVRSHTPIPIASWPFSR